MMIYNQIKTFLLFFIMTALLLVVGSFFGESGIRTALLMAVVMNGTMYFFSDRIVLNMHRAKPLDPQQYRSIHDMVAELAHNMQIPQPKLWLINSELANAFATGRNPKHASVALTSSIIRILDEDELRGVLAHELSHVKNRDILISTIAATMASAISSLAYMLRNAAAWHSSDDQREQRRSPNNLLAMIVVGSTLPFIATLVQLAISRSREYQADESGSEITHEPMALASALKKLEAHAQQAKPEQVYNPATALGIVHPFRGGKIFQWLATHPPMIERIKRLEQIQKKLFQNRSK